MNKTAFFFPGQGSQSVGMMSGFGDNPYIKQVFIEASDILKIDFWAMATEPNELLNQTQHTQPLMLTAGVATYRAFIQACIQNNALQANIRIITATAKKLDMSMEKVIVTVDKHGNTSAASIPLALDVAVRDGRIKRGDIILMEAFGGGFTWGSALIKY